MEYTTSFTAGGLLYNEIDSLEIILMKPDWNSQLEKDVKENRLLKINSEASRKRVAQELRLRMPYMTADFWSVYNEVSELDKKGLLFYVCLQTYKLIYDFHFNVTVPKFLSLEKKVEPYWYEMRLQELSSSHPEVNNWTEQTKRKVVTRYIDILRKVGLIEKDGMTKQTFSATVFCFFLRKGDLWTLDAFFMKQAEKETIINFCNDN
jgi:hypothetical protein